MKKLLVLLMTFCLALGCVACGEKETSEVESIETEVESTSIETEEKVFTEHMLVKEEDFAFSIKDIEVDEEWGCVYINVYAENNKNIPLTFSWDNVSINGYMIDPCFGTDVEPEKKENTNALLSIETLEENGIEKIEEMTLTLTIYNYNEDTMEITPYFDKEFTVSFE